MTGEDPVFKEVMASLTERKKELNCLYSVDELLHNDEQETGDMLEKLVKLLPPAWQYTTVCEARVIYRGRTFKTPGFRETNWMQSTHIIVDNRIAGTIDVAYTEFVRQHGHSQFLPEEQMLLNAIAKRLEIFLFHGEIKKSLAYVRSQKQLPDPDKSYLETEKDEYWKWRMHIVELIAGHLDAAKYGVEKLYVAGSTWHATAGPASDIDLIVLFAGNEQQKHQLRAWFEGWSLCISEMNYIRTGYKTQGMIDLHIITQQDIEKKSSFAVMLTGSNNAAKEIVLTKKT